jgi:hypothetical protein
VAALLADVYGRLERIEALLAGAENPQVATVAPAAPNGAAVDGPDALALALGNSRLAAVLVAGGFGSLAAVRAASDGELLAVAGVTVKALKLIRAKVG